MVDLAKARRDSCPNKENHTNGPDGYISWHQWARRQGKTHTQKKCAECGLFVIWDKKKVKSEPS